MPIEMKALIALEDGRVFSGTSFGAAGERYGELVFNTSMAGYQEILTDPSYKGQIVTMTYPLIGNYGVNSEDIESGQLFLEGLVIKELSGLTSSWRAQKSLQDYLRKNNILGIEGVDTRALTKHIRLQGAMKAAISTQDLNEKNLIARAKSSPGLIGRDLVKEVSCARQYEWRNRKAESSKQKKTGSFRVVVLDCGVKFNILRELGSLNCKVIVVPAKATAEKILRLKPDGLLLSNGPGDPAAVSYVVQTVRTLITRYQLPIFGICLGHQILGLALGGKTYKLKFGHHGGNHPVKDLRTGKVAITVQNHGFCLESKEKQEDEYYVTHINLNDGTCEGIRHKRLPVFSVQFHPESGPGPQDAVYLFREFIEAMERNSAQKNRHS